MSFLKLKQTDSNDFMAQMQDAIEKTQKVGGGNKDETSFYPQTDKDGNGFAIIRFMPPPANEKAAQVKIMSHWFKGKGGRIYSENCPSTIGKHCPACESNTALWATGPAGEDIVRKERKRQTNFYTNVYVVSDPKNPEREGKVFKFRFGIKIWEKILAASSKSEVDPTHVPFNPFDLWKGANFKLVIRKVDKKTNYDMSSFEKPGPLLDDDSLLEQAYNSCYSLQELMVFKDEKQLKTKLNQVLGSSSENIPSMPSQSNNKTAEEMQFPEDNSTSNDSDADMSMFSNNTDTDAPNDDWFKDM